MDHPGAGVGLQLWPLRSQAHPPVLRPAHDQRERGLRGGEERAHHVHQHAQVQVLGCGELLGPGHHIREVGQDLRRQAYQVLAPVRVVRQPRQAGLPRSSTLHGLVFQAQERVRPHAQGVRRLPPYFPQAWHANLRRLAGVLQQPGRYPFLEALQKMKEVLHRPWGGHLQGCGLPPGRIPAVHLAQDAAASPGLQAPGALHPQQGGVRHAEGGGGRRPKSRIHAQARGGRDPHPLPPVRGRAGRQAHPGVRRQFAVPQHHDEGDALRSWSRHDSCQPRGYGAGVPPTPMERGVVRLRGGGHRSPPGVVARVRGVSASLRQPQHPRQRGAEAHARLPEEQREQAFP